MKLCNWRLSICGLNMHRYGSTFFRSREPHTSTIFRRKASMFDGVKFWPIPLWYDQPIACGAVLLLFSACVRPFSEAKIKSQVRPCKSWGILAGHSSTALGDYPPFFLSSAPMACPPIQQPGREPVSWWGRVFPAMTAAISVCFRMLTYHLLVSGLNTHDPAYPPVIKHSNGQYTMFFNIYIHTYIYIYI